MSDGTFRGRRLDCAEAVHQLADRSFRTHAVIYSFDDPLESENEDIYTGYGLLAPVIQQIDVHLASTILIK